MPLNIEFKDYTKKTYNKPKYFDWTPGQHLIRILDVDIPRIPCYWFGDGYVRQLGWDDPQSTLNKRIRLENPETYKNIKGYRSVSDRYFVNVLDKTLVKICPNCNGEVKPENGSYPAICYRCNSPSVAKVTEIRPLNEVRILSGGKTLFEQFAAKDNSVLDENGNPRGIQNFDINLVVVGTGNKRNPVALETTNYDKVEVPPEQKYDTANLVTKVTPDEMEQMIRGVKLRDIWAARRVEEVSKEVDISDEELTDINTDEVKRKVSELFEH